MKKKILIPIILILILSLTVACEKKSEYDKFSDTFFGTFDTVTTVVAYTKDQEEFDSYMDTIKERFEELHKLYDKFNSYEGINNIKTINDNAGKEPVKVEKEIIDMLVFSKEWYYKAGEETNIAIGKVVDIWHDYTEAGNRDPENAKLPPMEDLKEAAKSIDIDKIIIDEENSTVYLEDSEMMLDVGAVAKGYATELVALEIEEKGLKSALISAGGNIRAIGKPLDNLRERWGVGIKNPDEELIKTDSNLLETVFVRDASVVTSGDYERYFTVDGKNYHHIIDPHTLMPGDHYRAITIVTPDSGLADFLSTSVFLLPFEESKALVESLEEVEAFWVLKDGTIEASEGMKKIMLSNGASGKDKE